MKNPNNLVAINGKNTNKINIPIRIFQFVCDGYINDIAAKNIIQMM